MISRIEYGGWKNNVLISNGVIELVTTLDVGPRIIRFATPGGRNVFKEFAEQMGGSGESEWMVRGGHRFWHAPEAKPRTYALDNGPVKLVELDDFSVRLISDPECENGVQKELDIIMDESENRVTIIHRLTNIGPWEIELAPWALTVMEAGGVEIIPLPEKRPHTEVLTPDFPLVLWPYTNMADNRYMWGERFITLTQDPAKPPTKIGMAQQLGWAAYRVHNTLFVKYFDYDPNEDYPDFGCNFETFTNEDMLEVESLGPLSIIAPEETIEHVETWRLVADAPPILDEKSISAIVERYIEA